MFIGLISSTWFNFVSQMPYISHVIVNMYLEFTLPSVFPKINTFFSHFREKLNAEFKACQAEKQSVESKLSSFEILGKEFEALAEEYCRLRREIEMKKWALKEFAHYSNKQN